ncbi:MAG: glycosyltransferase [Legionellales bacterium]|nr:glycosyltransferase [Legionellales bacterium]
MKSAFPISIVIPVFNERDNLLPLISEIHQALPADQLYEIIVVDDGSTDGTRKLLSEQSRKQVELVGVYHRGNYGQSAALLSGIRQAQYPWIITLDGDGQNDPHDIPSLLTVLAQQDEPHHCALLGNRKKRDDRWLRRLSSRIGNGVRNAMLGDQCPDTGCSLKCFPRASFMHLPHFNHMHRFLPALLQRAGLTVINLPVNHRPRQFGQSKYGVMNRLWVGITDILGVMWLQRRSCQPEVEHD